MGRERAGMENLGLRVLIRRRLGESFSEENLGEVTGHTKLKLIVQCGKHTGNFRPVPVGPAKVS